MIQNGKILVDLMKSEGGSGDFDVKPYWPNV